MVTWKIDKWIDRWMDGWMNRLRIRTLKNKDTYDITLTLKNKSLWKHAEMRHR